MTKIPPWSFSFLNCFNTCPKQAEKVYVTKDVKRVESKEMKHGNDVHEAMERRVGQGKSLPARFKEYENFAVAFEGLSVNVEMKLGVTSDGFACDFFDDRVWGRGKLDICVVDRAKQAAFLTDWKTGRKRENPFELKIQAVLLQAKHPELRKIVGHYVWLKDMKVGEQHDLSDTRATWTEICETMHKIEEAHRLDYWPVKEGIMCQYCPVTQCVYNRSKEANK